jgi:transposase
LGWGTKRIARELGVSRGTVKRYLEAGGWQPSKKPGRKKLLDGLEDWHRASGCSGIAATPMWYPEAQSRMRVSMVFGPRPL